MINELNRNGFTSFNKEVKWWKIIWKGEQTIIRPYKISFKL